MTRPSIYNLVYTSEACGQPCVLWMIWTYHMDGIHAPHALTLWGTCMDLTWWHACTQYMRPIDTNVAPKLFYPTHIHLANKCSIWNNQRKASGRLERRSSCLKAHWVRAKTGNQKFNEQKGKPKRSTVECFIARSIFRWPENINLVASEVTHTSSWFILENFSVVKNFLACLRII